MKKIVVIASSGLVLDFEVYKGESTDLVHKKLDLGSVVVLTLVQTLTVYSYAYFDRYFNTIPLLEELKKKEI